MLAGIADVADTDHLPALGRCVTVWGEITTNLDIAGVEGDSRLLAMAATSLRELLEMETVVESLRTATT